MFLSVGIEISVGLDFFMTLHCDAPQCFIVFIILLVVLVVRVVLILICIYLFLRLVQEGLRFLYIWCSWLINPVHRSGVLICVSPHRGKLLLLFKKKM